MYPEIEESSSLLITLEKRLMNGSDPGPKHVSPNQAGLLFSVSFKIRSSICKRPDKSLEYIKTIKLQNNVYRLSKKPNQLLDTEPNLYNTLRKFK